MNFEERSKLIAELEEKAKEMKRFYMLAAHNDCPLHLPSALSSTEIAAAIYFHYMNIDFNNLRDPDRDRFLLSAGHKSLVLYALMYITGHLNLEDVKGMEHLGTKLAAHPVYGKCPGAEASTGSLGHGMSIACGMALHAKMAAKSYRVYTIVGDGESHEGTIWEAAMAAAKFELDNLIVIHDVNNMCATYPIDASMPLGDIKAKWESFGFAAREINGHDMGQIVDVLEEIPFEKGKPNVIIAHTIKGNGVPFITNSMVWHSKVWSEEDIREAERLLGLEERGEK